MLTGVYASPSPFQNGASYLEVFAPPLYAPAEQLDCTTGWRVGGTRASTPDDLASVDPGLAAAASFLDEYGHPTALFASP